MSIHTQEGLQHVTHSEVLDKQALIHQNIQPLRNNINLYYI